MTFITTALRCIFMGLSIMVFGCLALTFYVLGWCCGTVRYWFELPTRIIEWGRRWSRS